MYYILKRRINIYEKSLPKYFVYMMDGTHWYIIVIALIDPLNSTVLIVQRSSLNHSYSTSGDHFNYVPRCELRRTVVRMVQTGT